MNQARLILLLLLNATTFYCIGQDTIYSTPYPKGILTKRLETTTGGGGYRLWPVDNPSLEIVVSKKETLKINYHTGEKFVNKDYKPSDIVLLATAENSGKVYYSDVLDFNEVSIKKLFRAVKTLPQGIIKYGLISSDEADYSYQKYVGKFLTKFQGDPYYVYFNLLVKFKDGKIKYEYSDFVAVFEKENTMQNTNIFQGGLDTIHKEHMKTLDQLYARAARTSDKMKFWEVIVNNINNSIESLKKQCSDEMKGGNDW
jgi:hypothetical protein